MPAFEKIYEAVSRIPKGKVSTYGAIARLIGSRDVRKVGWALHANPDGEKVPCHRVVNKEGRLAPGYAFGGPGEQKKKLEAEGVPFKDEGHVDLERALWEPEA
ncbi:MAG: methylated-DNA--[protein]-cysteine S-methyltransferase [bacterium]|nr:methylated-DNA--[protein]-cysteine S-methyltransferase [bacterium]